MPCCRWLSVSTGDWFLLINTSVSQTLWLSWQTSLHGRDRRKAASWDLCLQHFLFFFSPSLSSLYLFLLSVHSLLNSSFPAHLPAFLLLLEQCPPHSYQHLCPYALVPIRTHARPHDTLPESEPVTRLKEKQSREQGSNHFQFIPIMLVWQRAVLNIPHRLKAVRPNWKRARRGSRV